MSDPKRYGFPMCECDATDEFHMEEIGMTELKDGGFVLWSDYEKLKAENARILKLFADTERLMLLDGEYEAVRVGTFSYFKDLVERISAENNRLRFAGDMLADCLDGSVTCLDHNDVIARWKSENRTNPNPSQPNA